MNINKIIGIFLFAFFISSFINAQDEQTKIWMEYMTPGEVHQSMAEYVGEWNTQNKMWMTPDAPPTESTGSCKIEMLLGGRYLKTTHTGNYMGMPFEGFSIEGYDKALNIFNNVWFDNFGTGMMIMKGIYDNATQTLNYKGTMVDPVQKKEISVREVVHFKDPNKILMEMFGDYEGKEFKTMEIIFTRK